MVIFHLVGLFFFFFVAEVLIDCVCRSRFRNISFREKHTSSGQMDG